MKDTAITNHTAAGRGSDISSAQMKLNGASSIDLVNSPASITRDNLIVAGAKETREQKSSPRIEKFKGSHVAKRSAGSDMLENVCIVRTGVAGIYGHIAIRSYTENKTHFLLHDATDPTWAGWTKETKGYPLDQWYNISSQSLHVLEDTILLMNVFNNPGHCLNDQIFSLAYDLFNASGQDVMPFYPRVLLVSTIKMFLGSCSKTMQYCCEFLEMLGLIDPQSIIQVEKDRPICFSRLIVPHIAQFRIPTTSSSMQAISALQQRMFQLTQSTLSNTEWLFAPSTSNSSAPAAKPTIFFYDRQGARRRVLTNSEDIKRDIEAQYHATVDLWGEKKWNKRVTQSVAKQAKIYNSAVYYRTTRSSFSQHLLRETGNAHY